MYLRKISLRDWKAYEAAVFEFPTPQAGRNVILIGGRNGFGKTSLFEAIAVGLFGREGLALVSRAAASADDISNQYAFKDFIERAINAQAPRHGRTSCHIGLAFETEEGVPISIERTWHFTAAGKLRGGEDGETIRVVKGVSRKPIGPDPTEPDPEGWYRDWISRNFLPVTLAGFFLFDGEAASAYANRDMSVQVRDGIEGLLGLSWLRQLAKHLRDYAANRGAQVPKGATTDAIAKLVEELGRLEGEFESAEHRLGEIGAEIAGAENERDAITRELQGYGGGTRAQLEELIRDRADSEKAYGLAEQRLINLVEADLPFALVGSDLKAQLIDRLEKERRRNQWISAAQETRQRIEPMLSKIDGQLVDVEPPLMTEQRLSVLTAVREALDQLWHPEPSDIPAEFRHSYARGQMGELILERIQRADSLTKSTVVELLEAMARASASLRRLDADIRASETTAPQLEEKRSRLNELERIIRALHEERGRNAMIRDSRRSDINSKRAELGRHRALVDQSERPARLAARAEKVAGMLDALIEDAWPIQSAAVAESMTNAIRKMAHRTDLINHVEISPDGEVKLMSTSGRNLRDLDLAAGEKQVFTQALFASIADVSQRIFPLIIDTPLGRLDEQHRLNILKYIAERDSQVFLVSTDTEVVGSYLDQIRGRVAKAYRIENVTDGNLGRSYPVEGYFPGQGF